MGKEISIEARLEAIARYMQDLPQFRPERHKAYAPPKHSVLGRMFSQRKLTRRQCRAAQYIYMDCVGAWGNSNGLVGSYSERVNTSRGTRSYDPKVLANAHQKRLEGVLNKLPDSMKPIFWMIIKEFDQNEERIDLRAFGSNMTSYIDGAQAQSAGVSIMQMMLSAIADGYLLDDNGDMLYLE